MIALKFCGSCNPQIDLSSLAARIKRNTADRNDIEVVPLDSLGINLLIILCGCPQACANTDEIKAMAPRQLVIAGESLAGTSQKEDALAYLLIKEIDRLLKDK